jgi:ferredoxin
MSIATKPHPEVTVTRCTGCGRCVAACPERLLSLEVVGYRKHAVLSQAERCTQCGKCIVECPFGALT